MFPRDPKIGASNFDIGNAIDLAVADGCDLLNLSLGGGPLDAVTDEAIKAARAAGTVCVIAAGNDAGPVANPGRHPFAACVSAMGFEGAWPKGAMQDDDITRPFGKAKSYIAAFSNTGPEIDLTGPGCGTARREARRRAGGPNFAVGVRPDTSTRISRFAARSGLARLAGGNGMPRFVFRKKAEMTSQGLPELAERATNLGAKVLAQTGSMLYVEGSEAMFQALASAAPDYVCAPERKQDVPRPPRVSVKRSA